MSELKCDRWGHTRSCNNREGDCDLDQLAADPASGSAAPERPHDVATVNLQSVIKRSDYWQERAEKAETALDEVLTETEHTPPAVHHECPSDKPGAPKGAWCWHDRTWRDGAGMQFDYTCSRCGERMFVNVDEWRKPAVAGDKPERTP